MPLPDFPPLDDATLGAIAAHHGIAAAALRRLPQVGIFNAIFALGDGLILRVPRDHPRFTGATENEAIAVPLARAAGVRTPRLVEFDASRTTLPVPYGVYERICGVELEVATPDPAAVAGTWRELGRDLARLHQRVTASAELVTFEQKTDPRPLPAIIAEAGYFGPAEARWLTDWLERLAPLALADLPQRFLHGDSQASNTMVDPTTLAYRAVIDWGGCMWGDIALDFAGVPLRAVPAMLAGYREEVPTDDTIEARILWRHLTIGLHQLRGTPKPDQSWGERPMGILLDALRFLGETDDPRWKNWRP
jgi:aminoglycoside phosphotransferase (APT) family kinase protein